MYLLFTLLHGQTSTFERQASAHVSASALPRQRCAPETRPPLLEPFSSAWHNTAVANKFETHQPTSSYPFDHHDPRYQQQMTESPPLLLPACNPARSFPRQSSRVTTDISMISTSGVTQPNAQALKLADFRTEISHLRCPEQWLEADNNYTDRIAESFADLFARDDSILSGFPKILIYRRLFFYIVIQLMQFPDGESALCDLRKNVNIWHSWDDVTQLQNHLSIRDHLLKAVERNVDQGSFVESIYGKLHTLGDTALCALLAVTITLEAQYKAILARRDLEAQGFLDLLQARLKFPIDPIYKPRHSKALIRLARASGLYPESLGLTGVEIVGEAVSAGAYGDVHMGTCSGERIAVKVIKVYRTSNMRKIYKSVATEAVVWEQLSHPNVLPFYGVYLLGTSSPRVCLVSPWMDNGNVVDYLADRAPTGDCVWLSFDVALGLEYLHSQKIVHGDLKGVNILITPSHRACLADFGLTCSTDKPSITQSSGNSPKGTLRWLAPELLIETENPDESTTKVGNASTTDVYALGVVFYEMFSGNSPFHNIVHDFTVVGKVTGGGRPTRPSHRLSSIRGLTDEMWNLIESCWAGNPSSRPSANQTVGKLRSMLSQSTDTRPSDDVSASIRSRLFRNQIDYRPPLFGLALQDSVDTC